MPTDFIEEPSAFLLNPKKFYYMLFEHGLFKEDLQAPNRQQSILATMRSVQDALIENRRSSSKNTLSSVLIVGQTHDDPQDAFHSLEHAQATGQHNEELLMLEREGHIHPSRHKPNELAQAAGKNSIIVFEKDVLGEGLTTLERSWLIGLYLAHLMIEGGQRPITLIIGENHSKDIKSSILVCLDYMGYSPSAANINLLPSANQNIPTVSGCPLTMALLRGEACTTPILETEPASVLNDFSETCDLIDENHNSDEENELLSTQSYNSYLLWKQADYISLNNLMKKFGLRDVVDIKRALVEEAANCDIEPDALREFLEQDQKELKAVQTANDLLILITAAAEKMFTNNNLTN